MKGRKRQKISVRSRMRAAFWQGSYTVEAAIVASLVIFVLGALMIGTFYVHDRALFQSISCEIASAAGNYATEKERSNAAKKQKKQVNASRFLGSRGISAAVSVGKKEISASYSAFYPVPGFAMSFLAGNSLPIQTSWSSQYENPTEMIRLIRGAGELLTGGND